MFESDADRLALIRAVGEQFSTGAAVKLWAVFDRPSFDADGLLIPVKNRRPELQCRDIDVEAHGLVKQSPITRDIDGTKFFVKDLEPDGTGMTTIWLSV